MQMTTMETTSRRSRIAVIGGGPIGCATAAYLKAAGHHPVLWSPTLSNLPVDGGKASFSCAGALSASFEIPLLASPAELAEYDTVIVCLPANAYAAVLAPLNDTWRDGQTIIVSGALSLSPLWLLEAAQSRGSKIQVVGWGTTITTAHFLQRGQLHVNPMRKRIDMAALGHSSPEAAQSLCQHLLGDRFTLADNLLLPTLANINPIAHAAEVIPNLSRMDKGEAWPLFGCFTQTVARLAAQLDRERLAIAATLGCMLPTLEQHYINSYHLEAGSLETLARAIHEQGMGPNGPSRLEHRYVLEDAPFGLVFTESLGRIAAVPTPVLSACITLLQVFYERDFRSENFLVDALALKTAEPVSLLRRCTAVRNAASVPS